MSVDFDSLRKPIKESLRVAGPYPYYGASGIVDHVDGYLFDGEYLLVAEDGENLRTRNTPFAFRATGKFWVNNHAHVLQGNWHASTRFLNYALLAADIAPYITGAVMPKLTKANLKKIELPCPPPEIQHEVAGMLGALDDQIENFIQINATLEATVAALFKSRFVDFESTASEDFQDSELGLIPRSWSVASLETHIDSERGLSYKGSGLEAADHGEPMHNLNSVLEFGGYKYAGIKHYSGPHKERHVAVAGDIIVANTEQGHEHRLIGYPAIVPGRFSSGLYSHHLYRVRIKTGSPVTREWLYHCLMSRAVREQIIGCANGSTVNMLKPAGLQLPRFVLPPHDLCAEFDAIARPIREKTEANVEQIEALSKIRDALLPRLVGGRLPVSG
jgi:type I restriction enzyme S subunit